MLPFWLPNFEICFWSTAQWQHRSAMFVPHCFCTSHHTEEHSFSKLKLIKTYPSKRQHGTRKWPGKYSQQRANRARILDFTSELQDEPLIGEYGFFFVMQWDMRFKHTVIESLLLERWKMLTFCNL